jgi:hypothetical protein
VLSAAAVILTLKIAVVSVTVLLIASLVALARGKYEWHGRINLVFFALTLIALIGLEVVARLLEPDLFRDYFTRMDAWAELYVHLAFAVPSAVMLPILLYSGLRRRIALHYPLALVFIVFWIGTFVTGVFFLPHTP